MMKRALLAVLLCIAGIQAAADAKTPGEVAIGQSLRDAPLSGLNGPSRRLSDYRGKPLIINVWASWCGPCREEMASLERLAWSEQPVPFTVIGISTDDDPEQAKAFMKQANSTINQFIDVRLQMENMLGAARLPLTLLIDSNGRVLAKVYGAQQWDSPAALARIHAAFSGSKASSRP
jgi:thiol-disulfide isomerase/thioredoxin